MGCFCYLHLNTIPVSAKIHADVNLCDMGCRPEYARAAQFLGLVDPGATEPIDHLSAQQKEDLRCKRMNLLLRRSVFDLAKSCDQPTSIFELGISEDAFEAALPALIKSSYTDMSLRTNPALPLFSEVQLLMISAYPVRDRP